MFEKLDGPNFIEDTLRRRAERHRRGGGWAAFIAVFD
jgi:hypothetical protein